MGEKWMIWTLLESGGRIINKTLQKVVGRSAQAVMGEARFSFDFLFFATAVKSFVQTVVSLFMILKNWRALFQDIAAIGGACLFGFFAIASEVMAFGTFMLDGDLAVNTLIIALSIVPGAIFDVCLFKHKLSVRQWLGIFVAILAGWSILGWPSITEVFQLPLWVILSFGTMSTVAINQVITQKIRRIDAGVKNFWGGLTVLALSLTGLYFAEGLGLLSSFSGGMKNLWIALTLAGVTTVGIWTFNLFSYKGGAFISLKKLVMNGSRLIVVTLLGILIYSEPLTAAKLVGIVLFFAGFSLMDDKTWAGLDDFFYKYFVQLHQD